MIVNDGGTHFGAFGLGGVLAKGFGPEAVAVAAFAFASKADVAAAGDFLPDAPEIGSQFNIWGYPNQSILEGSAEPVSHFLLDCRGEGDGFDFPAETFFGSLG